MLDKFVDEHGIFPHALDALTLINEDALAILDIVLELSYVDAAIRVDLLRMSIADSIVEMANHFCPICQRVAPIACHLRVAKLPRVLVPIVERNQAFAGHKALAELAFVDPIEVVQDAETVKIAVVELTFILQLIVGPKVYSLAIEKSILKLSFIVVPIGPLEHPSSMDDIGVHVTLVCVLDGVALLVGIWSLNPSHFAVTMHLGIDEIPDIMAPIWPLKFSETLDLRIFQLASIDVVFVLFAGSRSSCAFNNFPPLFKSLAVDLLTIAESSRNLNRSKLKLFDSLATHLVSHPVAIVFRAIERLSVASLTMEETLAE